MIDYYEKFKLRLHFGTKWSMSLRIRPLKSGSEILMTFDSTK